MKVHNVDKRKPEDNLENESGSKNVSIQVSNYQTDFDCF